jgi:hypothetical protein
MFHRVFYIEPWEMSFFVKIVESPLKWCVHGVSSVLRCEYVALLWALPTPQTILADRSDWELSHPVRIANH